MFITEKIIIKDLPFNISNAKVLDELEGIDNISILSRVMYSRERDHMNNLTDCRNGDRFLYVRGPVILLLQKKWRYVMRNVLYFIRVKNYCIRCKEVGHIETNIETWPAYTDKNEESVERVWLVLGLFNKTFKTHHWSSITCWNHYWMQLVIA